MENMDNERDILILTDEDDNEIQLEILRFFFYNGEEYAMVTEVEEEQGCGGCGGHDHNHDHDHGCGGCGGIEVFFMKVDAVDDENEEYSFVDEALSQELMRVIESQLDDEFDEDEDDDEEDEEEDKEE